MYSCMFPLFVGIVLPFLTSVAYEEAWFICVARISLADGLCMHSLSQRLVPPASSAFSLLIPPSYSKDRPRFGDHLDVIKFLCKEVWAELFKKQVDNLRTDNHGRYVLQDNTFRWLGHVSMNSAPAAGPMADRAGGPVGDPSLSGSGSAASDVVPYLFFPCGIIRGALTSLGVPCTVSSEVTALPACSFTICVKT
eukprot:jgi/Mesvir1/29177/Mv20966-RA.1